MGELSLILLQINHSFICVIIIRSPQIIATFEPKIKRNPDEDIGIAGIIYSFSISKGLFDPAFAGIKDFVAYLFPGR